MITYPLQSNYELATYRFFPLTLFLLLLFCFTPLQSRAQSYDNRYRPPVEWHQLMTQEFRIVYPAGYDSVAKRTAAILQTHYQKVQETVGGTLLKFPVVLNPYNDRSNGFVSAMNFRMEVEMASVRGKTLSPESGDWLSTVMPHELVHALHLNKDGGFTEVVKLFSPDYARSMHLAIPAGILEGIAVEYESDFVRKGGGRGHYSYFTNPIYAIRSQEDPWSMGELTFRSSATLPYDRHYLGGYDFTDWLHDSYGSKTTLDAIDFYSKWPFLGYGVALRHATGKWPGALHDQYKRDRKQSDQGFGKPHHDANATVLNTSFDGEQWYKPVWTSNQSLLAYGTFYNARSGFYEVNITDPQSDPMLLYESRESEDHIHPIVDKNGINTLYFSRYIPHKTWNRIYHSQLFSLNINNQSVQQISDIDGLYAPFTVDNSLYALQSWKNRNRLLNVSDQDFTIIYEPPFTHRLIEISPRNRSKNDDLLAVVANQNGQQALWLTRVQSIRDDLSKAPALSVTEGSIFDPTWHPDGDKLLLTIDHDSTMQIYEYHLDTEALYRITQGTLNAMEPAISPDGAALAYIVQEGNERRLAQVNYQKLSPTTTSIHNSKSNSSLTTQSSSLYPTEEINQRADTTQWQHSSYSDPVNWLRPRVLSPGVEEENDGYVYSVNFYSSDLLQRHTYDLSLSYKYERLWHDFSYRYTGFYPGFDFGTFSDAILINNPDYYLMERRFELGVPFPIQFDGNNRSSHLAIRPFVAYSQVRALEKIGNEPFTDFTNRPTLGLSAGWSYRLQANPRDMQPNTGWRLFAELQKDLSVTEPAQPPKVGLPEREGFNASITRYLSLPIMRRWNQSLQIKGRYLTQSNIPIFNTDAFISDAFDSYPFPNIPNNIGSLSARYTIPLAHVDDGGFLVPAYLKSIYLVGFSSTVGDLDRSNWISKSQSILGAGLRTRFQFGAIHLDLGIALTWEPSTNQINYFIGGF